MAAGPPPAREGPEVGTDRDAGNTETHHFALSRLDFFAIGRDSHRPQAGQAQARAGSDQQVRS